MLVPSQIAFGEFWVIASRILVLVLEILTFDFLIVPSQIVFGEFWFIASGILFSVLEILEFDFLIVPSQIVIWSILGYYLQNFVFSF